MASYSEFDGVPIHISHEVLTKLLRGRMGFTGTVVSDYVGVGWAQKRQRAAASPEEVGALALAAGMDVELPNVHGYGPVLVKAVQSGKVNVLLDPRVDLISVRSRSGGGSILTDPRAPAAWSLLVSPRGSPQRRALPRFGPTVE